MSVLTYAFEATNNPISTYQHKPNQEVKIMKRTGHLRFLADSRAVIRRFVPRRGRTFCRVLAPSASVIFA